MTTRIASIYSITLVIALAALAGCSRPPARITEVEKGTEAPPADPRGFDPLELPRDRDIIPREHPRTGDIIGRQVIVEADAETGETDSTDAGLVVPEPMIDSLNNQAYRVQLFTSRVYGEARKASRVAEEIFDQPVFVDYEVPNYKVRVGSFADRDAAERYQQQAKAAGYTNAWVVMVNVGVREVAPLYDDMTDPFLDLPQTELDSTTVENEGGGDTEN
jgi:hypothetical protein